MDYLFIKLWTPKDAWYQLNQEQRVEFIQNAQEKLKSLHDKGMETIAWMEVQHDTVPYKTDHKYCSIYKFKDKQSAHELHSTMKKFRWYDYFEQTNICGDFESPGGVLSRVVQLPNK
jgi:hypothetical protein